MQPIQSVKNQYRGINAHLHSTWQAEHKWNRFHNYHIGQLMAAMKAQLLPMGYTAEMDESLQVRRVGDDVERRPRSDLLIRDRDPQRVRQAGGIAMSREVRPLLLEDIEESEEDVEHPYTSVVIYERLPDLTPGNVVGWVELLSPTNKGETRDAYTYLAKRRLLLERGIVFVEVDYLHETPPTFDRLADYTKKEADAHPYRLIVLDPRLGYRSAPVFLHEFDVDETIPTVRIPLKGDDTLIFDFNMAYQKSFEDALYGLDSVDYGVLPRNLKSYTQDDQRRIALRMLSVLEAKRDNLDLETGPFQIKDLSLEDALQQIKVLQAANS